MNERMEKLKYRIVSELAFASERDKTSDGRITFRRAKDIVEEAFEWATTPQMIYIIHEDGKLEEIDERIDNTEQIIKDTIKEYLDKPHDDVIELLLALNKDLCERIRKENEDGTN